MLSVLFGISCGKSLAEWLSMGSNYAMLHIIFDFFDVILIFWCTQK
jgi:hypothetical protein